MSFFPSQRFLRVSLRLLLVWTVAATAHATQVLPVDRVIAVVNNEVITERELYNRLVTARNRLLAQNQPLANNEERLRRELLEQIILERAESQHASELGIQVTEQQIDRAIETIAKENKLSAVELTERLASEGVTQQMFRADVRNQIVRARIRETVIQSRITVSDADIDAQLLARSGAGALQPQYNVRQVFVRVPEGSSESTVDELKANIELLRTRLLQGEAVDVVALDASDAPDNGNLGWRQLKDLPEIFAREVREMKAGDFSPVVRSPAGLHVLQLIDVRKGGGTAAGPPVVQTRVRHILIRPEDGVGETEILRRLAEIRDRVLGGTAQFEDMARQYSVDGSAGRGGDIGWVYPGDTVPRFERAMNNLAPGQISEPVRTQFGFHLIQLIERREEAASQERQRRLARQEIIRKRTAEAYREWRAELRDRTYVELRLE